MEKLKGTLINVAVVLIIIAFMTSLAQYIAEKYPVVAVILIAVLLLDVLGVEKIDKTTGKPVFTFCIRKNGHCSIKF